MDFKILGPLQVLDGARAVAVNGARQRALLALLLLHANEVVSTDRLLAELWGDDGAGSCKALQVAISRLRRSLEPQVAAGAPARVLVTRAPGYELRVEPGRLDVQCFVDAVAGGREALGAGNAAIAAQRLAEALSLWHGPALADFRYEEFAQAEIARLEDLRFCALEDRISADLELGRHHRLVGELEQLVAEHPYRERLAAALITALYRSGRQAEALEVYRSTRRRLVEELGIEPSRELKDLEQAVLTQDAALDVRSSGAAVDVVKPVPRGVLVGRERELEQLGRALEEALGGRGRLVLVAGESGIGKSRLVDELTVGAQERGARVLVGRCWEAGGAPAYWPWVQSLRSYLRGTAPAAARDQLGRGASELAQMLPEVRELLADVVGPASVEPEGARFRLFDATASFLRNATRAQPLVLVLDDLHVADTPSLLLLQFLAGELADAGIMFIGTYRDVELRRDAPLVSTLVELGRQPMTQRLQLDGLTEAEVARFIALTAGFDPPAALAAAIHDQTEGNPLFVDEVVRMLAAEGRLERAESWRAVIPRSAREVIGRRLSRLPTECTELLALGAVLGREFSLDALARVSELGSDQALTVLDEALATHVLSQVTGARGRLRFSHGLVRDVIYDELSPARRAGLHLRIGETLEQLYAADPEPHLAELCHHFFEAAPAGDTQKSLSYARRAGDRAGMLFAYEEAVRHYRMAVELLECREPVDEALRCDLLLAIGEAQMRAGDAPAARETFAQAAETARTAQLAEQLGRAALGYGGRFAWSRAGGDNRVVSLLEEALGALDDADSTTRVHLLARLAGALRDIPTRERAAALSAQAVEMARRLADPAALAFALDARHVVIWGPDSGEERGAITDELNRLAQEAQDPERAFQARFWRLEWLFEFGDLPAVRAELDAAARAAERLRQPAQLWYVAVTQALLALFEGRLDEAEGLIEQAFTRGRQAQSWEAQVYYRMQMFGLRSARGGLEEIEETIVQSVEEYPAYRVFRCVLASVYAELGREVECRAVFEDLAVDDFAGLPRDEEWLFGMTLLASVCARLRDRRRAALLYELLSPYADRNALSVPDLSTGAVSRVLGLLAATTGQRKHARTHFEHALELNGRMGARPWLARTQHDYAILLSAAGPHADREKSRTLFTLAIENYRRLAMDVWADRASRDQRVLSVATTNR